MNKRTAAFLIAIVVVIGGAFIGIKKHRPVEETSSEVRTQIQDYFSSWIPFQEEDVLVPGDHENRIAVLSVEGAITGSGGISLDGGSYDHKSFMGELQAVYDDPTVKAVFLTVNSPGGGVYESREIRDAIQKIRTEKKIPVYVYMKNMAASGGYYISAETDKIIASPETLTGSIGVIMQSINYKGLLDKYGVKYEVFKSAAKKDILSPTREMTDDERAVMQSIIDNSYARFLKVVSDGRKIPIEKLKPIADGRVYDGDQAKAIGLVDALANREEALNMLKQEQNLEDAEVFCYTSTDNLFKQFFGALGSKSELGQIIGLPKANSSLMYIYEGAL